jgi:nicotinate-nucleotide pyrophosphorylase (carboxylating)
VIEIYGRLTSILSAERVAVNFLSRLSGVSTTANLYVNKIAGTKAKILDTRKTTPGMRLAEKYAVRMGGGSNHRVGLYDGIIIKDNHLKAARLLIRGKLDDKKLLTIMGRMKRSLKIPIEIEVESLREFNLIIKYNPEVIMLDNFNIGMLKKAVEFRDNNYPNVKLEASGGINLKNVRAAALTGVDFISIGCITHSPKALDFSLEISHVDD